MHERENYDRLINEALRTYAAPQADGSLEARVLARIEEARQHRRGWRMWVADAALAGSVLLVVLLTIGRARFENTTGHLEHPTIDEVARAVPKKPVPQPALSPPARSRTHARTAHAEVDAHPSRPPRLPFFPSPAPLTAEEKALVYLVSHATPAELKGVVDAQQKTEEPLHIASISIAPIEPPTEGKE